MKMTQVKLQFVNGSTAFLAFLCATTVSLAVTSFDTRPVLLLMRYAAVFFCIGWMFSIVIQKKSLSKETLLSLYVFALIVSYGLLISCIYGGIEMVLGDLLNDIVFLVLGVTVVSMYLQRNNDGQIFAIFLFVSWLVVIVNLMKGGLVLENPPYFKFEFFSESLGSNILYSQGMSKFMGLAALSSIIFMKVSESFFLKSFAGASTLIFLGLSFLGGARGDSVIAAFVVLAYAVFNLRGGIVGLSLVLALLGYIAAEHISFQDLVIIQRLSVILDGNYGQRDILLLQSIDLISTQWNCVVFGCGFGFFQYFFGYSFDLYPHNVFVELLISHGGFIFLLMIAFALIGVTEYQRRRSVFFDGNLAVSLLFLLISLKSGTFLSSYVFVAFLCCFFSFGFSRLQCAFRSK